MNVLALTAALMFVLDQFTKWLVLKNFQLHEEIPVIDGFFRLTFVTNRGAAWGLFSNFEHSNPALATFSILTVVMLWFARGLVDSCQMAQKLALGMVVGGIFGNLADRLLHGYVIDFLDFYLGSAIGHWPAFNIADSAICVGVGLYLIGSFWQHAKPDPEKILPTGKPFGNAS